MKMATKPGNKTLLQAFGIIMSICVLCACAIVFSNIINPIDSTPTSTPTLINNAPIIQSTANISPTPHFTATIFFLPTLTKPVIPTPITIPGSVNTSIPSPTYIFIMPTQQPGSSASCSCQADTLNCPDFSTYADAQACFDHCVAQGAGDIHRLDQDNDGLACEGLP